MRRWSLAGGDLDLSRPLGAGIVNVTVDSMFEGARSGTPEQAVRDGLALAEAGFEMLDVGAVAAKAGPPVSPEDEAAALVPAVEGLARQSRGSFRTDDVQKEPRDERLAMVGDRISSDIDGGRAAGLETVLVLSGTTSRQEAEAAEPPPDHVLPDLAALLQ